MHMTHTSPEISWLSYYQDLYLTADTDLRIFQSDLLGVHKTSRYPFSLIKLIAN